RVRRPARAAVCRGADAARRELLRVKNRLEGLLYTNERVFEQYREMLSKENAKRINETLTRARVALMNDSQAELETATFDLNSISRMLSEAMLDSGKDS
ncbi:MAG TPA: hypothetical protein PKX99_09060, partial [Thermoanaerobaculia bacterium]|nr:hypothetical protein [Thermoanaerobaculia bacterium]